MKTMNTIAFADLDARAQHITDHRHRQLRLGRRLVQMMDRPQRITFAHMRDMGVRGVVVYRADYNTTAANAGDQPNGWAGASPVTATTNFLAADTLDRRGRALPAADSR
jgi:hypothetical protein